jgi:Gpi18-like mannosyltransferase
MLYLAVNTQRTRSVLSTLFLRMPLYLVYCSSVVRVYYNYITGTFFFEAYYIFTCAAYMYCWCFLYRYELYSKFGENRFQDMATKQLVGCVVLTR